MNSISKNIKALRIAKGWTQQEVADKLSVSRQLVSNWESGRSLPSIDALTDISKKLLNVAIFGILLLTVYSYIPTLLQVDLKNAFRIANPTYWINYPDYSWLPSLPYAINLMLYNMSTRYRLLYSAMGIVYEILKPSKKDGQ